MTEAHRLPADWAPEPFQPGSQAWRIAFGFGPFRLEQELEAFRAYWTAAATGKAYKRDWQAAWVHWVINAEIFDRVRRRRGK